MKKRLFVAIAFPGELLQELISYEEKLKKFCGGGFRWTRSENFHLTLHFIGYLEEERLPSLQVALTGALQGVKCFEISFKEIVFAPPGTTRRMIWAIFESREYEELAKNLGEPLKEFTQKESSSRPVVPHLTLARFKEPSLAKGIKLPGPKFLINQFRVSSVELMESKLSPQGPSYAVINSWSLL